MDLHDQLDALIPPTDKRRSYIRIIGHALIDLGLLTTMECAYEDCVGDSREFTVAAPTGRPGHWTISVDHAISLSDGGNDRPSNVQLMHLKCNGVKGRRDAMKSPERRDKISKQVSERWKDPEYAAKVTAAATAGNRTEEARKKRSDSMRAHWADPAKKARHLAAQRGGVV